MQQRYKGEVVVKALYTDRGLVFCHGKYGLCPFSKIVSVSRTFRVCASRMVFLTPGTSTLCWESPVGVLKGPCFTQCLHPLQIFRMFKVLIEKQFLREGFSFSSWPGAWCRIYAYKFLITKLRDCSVHAYAEYIRSRCLSPLIEKLLCMWFG